MIVALKVICDLCKKDLKMTSMNQEKGQTVMSLTTEHECKKEEDVNAKR